jgi:hypothetical protein
MDDNMQHRECSYCKSILHNGHAHNRRTCQKALNQGKSNFMDYNNGIFKLLYIKGITQKILDNEFSIFALEHKRNLKTDEHCTNKQSDKILNVPKHNIALSTNEVENKKGSMITNK